MELGSGLTMHFRPVIGVNTREKNRKKTDRPGRDDDTSYMCMLYSVLLVQQAEIVNLFINLFISIIIMM